MKKIWLKFAIFTATVFFGAFLGVSSFKAAPVAPSNLQGATSTLDTAAKKAYGDAAVTLKTPPAELVGKIIAIALELVGGLFLALTVYGGYLWMMARGDDKQVEKARDLIKHAVIGLVIVLAAYIISTFVVGKIITATL